MYYPTKRREEKEEERYEEEEGGPAVEVEARDRPGAPHSSALLPVARRPAPQSPDPAIVYVRISGLKPVFPLFSLSFCQRAEAGCCRALEVVRRTKPSGGFEEEKDFISS